MTFLVTTSPSFYWSSPHPFIFCFGALNPFHNFLLSPFFPYDQTTLNSPWSTISNKLHLFSTHDSDSIVFHSVEPFHASNCMQTFHFQHIYPLSRSRIHNLCLTYTKQLPQQSPQTFPFLPLYTGFSPQTPEKPLLPLLYGTLRLEDPHHQYQHLKQWN